MLKGQALSLDEVDADLEKDILAHQPPLSSHTAVAWLGNRAKEASDKLMAGVTKAEAVRLALVIICCANRLDGIGWHVVDQLGCDVQVKKRSEPQVLQ